MMKTVSLPAETTKESPTPGATWTCKDVAPHGLWAMEPHLALGDVGVKFEEILIIDENGARWLDDDLPHHRRWSTYRASSVSDPG